MSIQLILEAKKQSTIAKRPELHELITVVYGDKKVGKSTFASRYKNPLFIDCENALRSVEMKDGKTVPKVPVASWQDILNYTDTFKKSSPDKTGVNTIVIDGMNEAFNYLRASILAANNVEHENDGVLAYGKGKGVITTHLRKWFNDLKSCTANGYGIVLTAHSTTQSVESGGVAYDKRVPLVSGDKSEWGWQAIMPSVDIILYAYKLAGKSTTKHMMSTKGNQMYEAADPTNNNRLPHDVPLSYQVFHDAYYETNKTNTTEEGK